MAGAKRITAVAVSGGVDSLYAMVSLKQAGEPVFALHARMLPPELAPPDYEAMLGRLGEACAALDVPLAVIDCVEAFAGAVITPFVRAYAAGLTPNPCAHCNAAVKFGLLLDRARELGAARLATGHYIRLEDTDNGPALFAAGDAAKDQSYFLSLVPKDRLALARSPLAGENKDAIRAFLAAQGIRTPAPGESQEICFVPGDDYRAFLRDRAAKLGMALPGPGAVTLPDNSVIGKHKGLWHYTEGQRKGLGIAWKEPLYVLEKKTEGNTLVVGNAGDLAGLGHEVTARDCNFLVPFAQWPDTVLVRTRFRQPARPASARLEGNTLILREETPRGPHARGQIATVYDRDMRVLGGGVIA